MKGAQTYKKPLNLSSRPAVEGPPTLWQGDGRGGGGAQKLPPPLTRIFKSGSLKLQISKTRSSNK